MPPVLSKTNKRYYNCTLPSCGYYAPNGFFGFPKNEKLREKWKNLCGMEVIQKCDRLCYQHFEDSQLIPRNQDAQPRLKLGAVPSLNLPRVRIIERLLQKESTY